MKDEPVMTEQEKEWSCVTRSVKLASSGDVDTLALILCKVLCVCFAHIACFECKARRRINLKNQVLVGLLITNEFFITELSLMRW